MDAFLQRLAIIIVLVICLIAGFAYAGPIIEALRGQTDLAEVEDSRLPSDFNYKSEVRPDPVVHDLCEIAGKPPRCAVALSGEAARAAERQHREDVTPSSTPELSKPMDWNEF
jgi:hypothetical protein